MTIFALERNLLRPRNKNIKVIEVIELVDMPICQDAEMLDAAH